MNPPELYTRVVVTRDLPEQELKKGDTAMYIEYLPSVMGDGAILEIFNALGQEVRIATVPLDAIESLSAEYVPSVRLIETA